MRDTCRFAYRGLAAELVGDVLTVTRGERAQRFQLWTSEDPGMQVLNNHGGAYFDGIDVSRDYDGDWFPMPGAGNTVSLSGELEMFGGATIAGELTAEYTCDPQKLKSIVPLTMPDGCLHTARPEIAWLTPGRKIVFTAAPSGTFGLTFVFVPLAAMRLRWHPTGLPSVTTGVSKLTVHATKSQV